MPLVRFEVKNEYGLGHPELYGAEAKKEDPREVLGGVAVAGLVGILRQLGDLAGFAADVFHGLNEQVTTMAARGRKISNRVQRIESALPTLEKAVQGQRSYLHLAYIAGSDWHASVQTSQSQLRGCDLPQFMIDFYEECRDPPRLYLLDKFDTSGAGACLKRYSDPSYFKRVLASSEPVKAEKLKRKKKKGSRWRSGGVQNAVFTSRDSNSTHFASPSTDQLSFSSEYSPVLVTRSKSELARDSLHFESETGFNGAEHVSDAPCVMSGQREYSGFSAPISNGKSEIGDASILHNEPKRDIVYDDSQYESLQQHSDPSSSSVTWDEKTEIVKSTGANLHQAELVMKAGESDSQPQIFESQNLDFETAKSGTVCQQDIVYELAEELVSHLGRNQTLDELSPGPENLVPTTYLDGDQFEEVPTENYSFTTVSCPDDKQFTEVAAETDKFGTVSYSCGNQFDGVSTGTNNFNELIDAVEKGMELGSEGQAKQELKPSNFSNRDLELKSCELSDTSATDVECTDAQASISGSSSYSNKFILSNGFDYTQPNHTPNSKSSCGNGFSQNHVFCMPGIRFSEPLESEVPPKLCTANEKDVVVSNGNLDETSNSEDSPANIHNAASVNIWTNGGILGLEPSKPPDFSANANSVTAATCNESKERNLCFVEEMDTSNSDFPTRKSSCVPSLDSSAPLCGKIQEAWPGGTNTSSDSPDHRETDAISPGSDMTTICNTSLHSSGTDTNVTGLATSFSGLAHKFLSNSVQRRILVARAGLSPPSQLVNADFSKLQGILLQNDQKELPKRVVTNALCEPEKDRNIEVASSGEPVSSCSPYSGSSSPPIEHMKISFHPMNDLDTAKLKLELSSGYLREGSGDLVFPSFQLIPGPSSTLYDSGSESDDDTFGRSSYSSDCLLNPHSDSNSELWEEDESIERVESPNHGVYDDFCGTSSSATSVYSSMKIAEVDICSTTAKLDNLKFENNDMSDPLRNLPSVDSFINYKSQHQELCGLLPFDSTSIESHSLNGLPPPPPLPPLQWRVVKQSDKCLSVEDTMSSAFTKVTEQLGAQSQFSASLKLQQQDAPNSPCKAEAVSCSNKMMSTRNSGSDHIISIEEQKPRESSPKQNEVCYEVT